jgi:membrane-bound lytic murein transglycosylase B
MKNFTPQAMILSLFGALFSVMIMFVLGGGYLLKMSFKKLLKLGISIILVTSSIAQAAAVEIDAKEFNAWLLELQDEAATRGFSPSTLAALSNIEPDPRVLGFDRKQPEFVQTFEQYLGKRVTTYRINKGREYYQTNKALLERIAAEYGVDAQYLVAFWGLESNFGTYQGKYSIIRSLATLAYDPRRSTFFRKELFKALQILDEGHISAQDFVGGWAGAMGQNQFMPSSFLNYAQDYDGDGRKNIWQSNEDVWASIANYLSKNRWNEGRTWGAKVLLPNTDVDFVSLKRTKPPSGCRAFRYHTNEMTHEQWGALGVKVPANSDLPDPIAMVIPEEGEKNAYLVGPNFSRILAYNCANKYAVSVGLLADEIIADTEAEGQ